MSETMMIKPILMFGMPRSGTTWLGKILDSHPDTVYFHEPDSCIKLHDMPLVADMGDAVKWESMLESYVNSLLDIHRTKVRAKLPVFHKSYYSPIRYGLHYLNVMTAKAATRFFHEFPVYPFIDYRKVPQLRPVWKSIESAGRLGVILRALTRAHAAYVVRHPCGYVASVLKGESQGRFNSAVYSSEDYGIFEMLLQTKYAEEMNLSLDRLRELAPVERLAWRWVLFNEKVLDDTLELERCTVFRYEDACEDPVGTMRKVFASLQLPWHQQTEQFIKSSTAGNDSGYYSVVKDPKQSAMKWKKQLAASDVDRILEIARGSKSGALFGFT